MPKNLTIYYGSATHTQSNYFILTGAMGAGKSSLIYVLEKENIKIVPEAARAVLKIQRSIDGMGVPEQDPHLFTELMLSHAISQYEHLLQESKPVVFDRGIVDITSYASLFGLDMPYVNTAAKYYRYNVKVFFAPPWNDIYCNDDERKMSYDASEQFGRDVKNCYEALGYEVVKLAKESVAKRAQFILDSL